MSSFNSPKYKRCAEIIEEEVSKGGDTSTLRRQCIERFMTDPMLMMSKAGASTYYSNLHKSNKVSVPVPMRERQIYDKDAFEHDHQMYSMVTVDRAKRAIDVQVFMDKVQCLDKCNKLNKHFIMGVQMRNYPLGTIRTKPKEVDDQIVDEILA